MYHPSHFSPRILSLPNKGGLYSPTRTILSPFSAQAWDSESLVYPFLLSFALSGDVPFSFQWLFLESSFAFVLFLCCVSVIKVRNSSVLCFVHYSSSLFVLAVLGRNPRDCPVLGKGLPVDPYPQPTQVIFNPSSHLSK